MAVIQPTKLNLVRQALKEIGVERLTIVDSQGFARQKGQPAMYRGIEYQATLLRKVTLQIAVNDDFLERTLNVITSVARTSSTGEIGDGKIFVLPLVEVIQINDGSRGRGAI
jgi:nitrogen regulatory protein P-II 1